MELGRPGVLSKTFVGALREQAIPEVGDEVEMSWDALLLSPEGPGL
jgi:hypothetical protein